MYFPYFLKHSSVGESVGCISEGCGFESQVVPMVLSGVASLSKMLNLMLMPEFDGTELHPGCVFVGFTQRNMHWPDLFLF